jgi:hypothetical protein
LVAVQQHRIDGALNPIEQSIREEILAVLLADKGGEAQISTAMHVLGEIIASDVSLLVMFNQAMEGVIQNSPKARANPKAQRSLMVTKDRGSVRCQRISSGSAWIKSTRSNCSKKS